MTRTAANAVCAALLCAALAACASVPANTGGPPALENQRAYDDDPANARSTSVFDLFRHNDNPNVTLEVNRYIWVASMEVLNFLPIESADPFSGVIVMGYGTPPGGRTPYRATVYVQDPALDARSLKVALATRGGPASTDTVRAVEDAILTRARQIRMREQGY